MALHSRFAPQGEAVAGPPAAGPIPPFGGDLHVQEDKIVVEIKPAGIDKGTGIEAFVTEMPFAIHRSAFIGDGVTDENGVKAVNRFDGSSVRARKGATAAARWRIGAVAELSRWLQRLPSEIAADARRVSGSEPGREP